MMFHKLESMRGVAACLVVLFHSSFCFFERSTLFVSNSYLFVDFFFILSGFVMSHAYGNKIGHGLGFIQYITLRLGRLYPLHFFMLLVWLPFILFRQYLYLHGHGGRDQLEDNGLIEFFANVFLLHAANVTSELSWNQPSWSISAEFFAYVVFYLVTVLFDRRSNLYLPLFISFCCYFFLFRLELENFDITYDFGVIRCIGAFYLGVFAFRIRPALLRLMSGCRANPLELISVALMILSVTLAGNNRWALVVTLMSFIGVLLIFSTDRDGWLGKVLHTMPMRKLGLWSYSIYMVHKIILVGLSNVFEFALKMDIKGEALGMLSIAVNTVALLATIAISRFTYIYIEKHFRDLVKRRVANFNAAAQQPAA